MWPDRVSNPGPLALEADALPTALRVPAHTHHLQVLKNLQTRSKDCSCSERMRIILCFTYHTAFSTWIGSALNLWPFLYTCTFVSLYCCLLMR